MVYEKVVCVFFFLIKTLELSFSKMIKLNTRQVSTSIELDKRIMTHYQVVVYEQEYYNAK